MITKSVFQSVFAQYGAAVKKLLPTLSGIEVANITDVSAEITGIITANSYDTVVEVEYGSTPSLGSSLFPDNSPFAPSKNQVAFSVELRNLLPYSWVFYRIVVTTSKGPVATPVYHFNTLEPVELTDGNWVAMWDAEYEKNVINASNQLGELRDKRFDCALGDEINPQPEFNSSTGFSSNAAFSIIDGKLTITNAASGAAISAQMVGSDKTVGSFRIETIGASGIAGTIHIRIGGLGANNSGALPDIGFTDGDTVKEIVSFGASNGYFYIRASSAGTSGVLENLSIKRILGKHAVINDVVIMPIKLPGNNFFSFDGNNDRLYAYNVSEIGSVYALAQRDGIDEDFVILNSLDGIGGHSGTLLAIGENAPYTTRYKVNVRRLSIRSVDDPAEVVEKLNEWFSRDSYELPSISAGVLGTGIWDDFAFEMDSAVEISNF